MQNYLYFILIPLALIAATTAVSGFSISSANYTLLDDGSGIVDLQYHLNASEKTQYDLINKLLDLKSIGKKELEKSLNRNVTVMSLSPDSVQLKIAKMAMVNGTNVSTPSFTYVQVEDLVDPSLAWVVQKFEINFIPHSSTIIFPDGYQETFLENETIPGINHQLYTVNMS